MRLSITGLTELRERLARLRVEEVMASALAEQAERMAQSVRESLSEPPGGAHDKPWARTGALRDSVGATASGLEATIGSNDPAAAPQEMGTAHIPPRPFLAPVAAAMGPEVAQAVAEAVAAALRGEPGKDPDIQLVKGSQTELRPFNPLNAFIPGSPENEQWVHDTLQLLRSLGHVLHSEEQAPEQSSPNEDGKIPALPENPDDLLSQGWDEITHPSAAANGRRTFRNRQTGLVIDFDKGEPGAPRYQAVDHYHIRNPDTTGKRDEYLRNDGRPTARGSKPPHIFPGEQP